MTIDPKTLSAEERAIMDHQAFRYHSDWHPQARYKAALNYCEPMILARRALFGQEPASEGAKVEMPEAVMDAWLWLRAQGWACKSETPNVSDIFFDRALALETFWNSHAAQPKVAMTEELERVLCFAERKANGTESRVVLGEVLADVRAVRAQYGEGRKAAQKVELPKVREALDFGDKYIILDYCYGWQSLKQAALAELDRVEGR